MARWLLIAWTVLVWGSRVRNIIVDVELSGWARATSLSIAIGLLALAAAVAWSIVRSRPWATVALALLAGLGVLRWTIRGPIILLSNEWEPGFKVVHTVLWAVTVVLSVLAWRENQRCREAKQSR